jgi:ABC-type dipeptide/oligopeptide/nickel transport system permease subunit
MNEPSPMMQHLRFTLLSAKGAWRAFARHRPSLIALIFLVLVTGISVCAPFIAPHDPYEDVGWRNSLPGEDGLLLGSDGDGRDVLSRLIWGGRISLFMGIVPTFLAMILSLLIGVVAAYIGKWADQIIMRVLDMFFAFPIVLMATVVAGILKAGLLTICVAIFIALIPYITRLVRTTTLTVKAEPYIEAAHAAGAGHWAILTRYIFPNVVAPAIVYTTTLMGLMIVLGSALGFLGFGVQPPIADWGTMVEEGRVVLRKAPHVTIFPGLAIVTVALAFGFIGDGLRDALDPRARSR